MYAIARVVGGALGCVVTPFIGLVNHANLRDKAAVGADLSTLALFLHQSVLFPTLWASVAYVILFGCDKSPMIWRVSLLIDLRGLLWKQSCPDSVLFFLSRL